MAELPASRADRWFDSYEPDAVFDLGTFSVTEEEIIAFARQYDPQEMHTDPALAAQGPFGGIIASGWHTIGMMMRLMVERFLPENGLAAPGIDELRWVRPVRPGDTLRVRATILEARRSRSKPDRGMIHVLIEVSNQQDELVLSMKPMNLVRCRPEPAAPAG